jgi:hypothetical protein
VFRFKHAVIAAALLSTMAFAAACSDDGETGNTAQQSDIDTLNARVERLDMMHGIIGLSKLGLHDMDESLAEGTIESSFSGNTRTAIRLLALTEWSGDLDTDAETVEGHAVDLLRALADEDVDAAADAAAALHDSEHDFSNEVWAVLAADLAHDAGGVEAHDEGETPAAGETDAGDHSEDAADETPAADASPTAEETPQ